MLLLGYKLYFHNHLPFFFLVFSWCSSFSLQDHQVPNLRPCQNLLFCNVLSQSAAFFYFNSSLGVPHCHYKIVKPQFVLSPKFVVLQWQLRLDQVCQSLIIIAHFLIELDYIIVKGIVHGKFMVLHMNWGTRV